VSPRVLAALEAAAGIAVLSLMDAVIKGLAARYPVFQIAFARYLVGSAAMLVLVALARPGWPSRETLRTNGVRALLVVATALTFFYALGTLPLAETLALSFISPIFVAVLGAAMLGEAVPGRVAAAMALGFVGMGVVVAGQLGAGSEERSLIGIAAVLVSAVTYALSMVLLRARAQRDPVITIVAIQNVGPALVLVGPAAAVWTPAGLSDWALLALIGLLGVAGHLLMSRAYARAEAARLAVMEYTALVWALVFGFVGFGEVPGLVTMAGACLIIGGSLLATRR
jgi:drug/metabolite transporter (DMT)-like permease